MEEHEDAQYCFQDRNSSCRRASISTSIYITLYIFFSLISVVTVFFNLLVIISISHFKHFHTPTNLLILSLAVSDLLVGLIVIPAMTVAILESCWNFGEYFCVVLLYTTFLCTTSSLGLLVLISIDRYVAVCDPLMYHLKITTTRMKYCIFISWCFCITYDAILTKLHVNVQIPSRCFEECYLVEGHFWITMDIDFVISMVFPCSIIITLYLKIFMVARSQAREVLSKGVASVSGVKTVQVNKSERKAAKILGLVIFNYLLFWNPVIFLFLMFSSNSLALFVLTFLPVINSFINPIIYALFYPWFKVAAKHILTMKFMCL